MERKYPASDADPLTELHRLAAEMTRRKIKVDKAYTRLNEVNRRYSIQPDDQLKQEKDALKVKLMEAWEEFYEAQARLRLACGEPGAGSSSGAGGSSQEAAGDVKMGTDLEGMQSAESSYVRTGIEGKGKDFVVAGGGDSGESEEQKKNGDVSTDAEGGSQD